MNLANNIPQRKKDDDPKKLLLVLSFIFALAGIIGVLHGTGLWRTWDKMRLWTPTPCVIITKHEKQLQSTRYIVEYVYIAEGRNYRSTRFGVRSLNSWSWVCRSIDTPTEQKNSLSLWPTGSIATCYVNPANSAQSVISLESPISFWLYGLAWILTILSVVCLVSYFHLKRSAQLAERDLLQKLLKEQRRTESLEQVGFEQPAPIRVPQPKTKRLALLPLAFMGTIAGIVFIAATTMVIIPAGKTYWIYGSRDLKPVPCETVAIDTVWASGGKYMNKGVQITFRYEFDGKQYQSTRYAGTSEYLSLKDSKKIEALFPGTTTKCYVNPAYPEKAVLVDDAELSKFTIPIFVTGFVLVWMSLFLSGLISEFRKKNKPQIDTSRKEIK